MSNQITVSFEFLDDLRARLNHLTGEFDDAANALGRVRPTSSSLIRLRMTRVAEPRLRSTLAGARVTHGTLTSTISSYRRALAQYREATYRLSRNVQRAAEMFAEMERDTAAKMSSVNVNPERPLFGNGYVPMPILKPFPILVWRDILRDQIERIIRIRTYIKERIAENEKKKAEEARVFDDNGQYGGDQNGPHEDTRNYKLFKEIIRRNTGRTLSGADLEKYLRRLNNEGCGYVSIVNSILLEYEGRPADFEKAFGFSMYKDGDLNYNELLVDLYSSTDNRSYDANGNIVVDEFRDYNWTKDGIKWWYDPYKDKTGSGTNIDERGTLAEIYLREHGITNGRTERLSNVTPSNFSQLAAEGTVNIAIGDPIIMRDASGQVVRNLDGGHAMTITGVKDGMFQVSSWGKTFYVNPADYTNATDGRRMDFSRLSFT